MNTPINIPQIGDPVACRGVVGRVCAINGGIVSMMTPGCSVIETGWLWTERPDMAYLKHHEALVTTPYGDREDLRIAMRADEDPSELLPAYPNREPIDWGTTEDDYDAVMSTARQDAIEHEKVERERRASPVAVPKRSEP